MKTKGFLTALIVGMCLLHTNCTVNGPNLLIISEI